MEMGSNERYIYDRNGYSTLGSYISNGENLDQNEDILYVIEDEKGLD